MECHRFDFLAEKGFRRTKKGKVREIWEQADFDTDDWFLLPMRREKEFSKMISSFQRIGKKMENPSGYIVNPKQKVYFEANEIQAIRI